MKRFKASAWRLVGLFLLPSFLLPSLLSLLLPVGAQAQINDPRLPISLHADSTDYDGKGQMLVFEGLRLTQGNIGIEADRGRASKLDFEDSVWRFEGNVVIDIDGGRIRCDTADLRFANHELTFATITGSPATYELRRPGSDETTYAEAGRLDYDLTAGTLRFSEQAKIIEGGNQIASNLLIYDIAEQRINAQSAADGRDKVQITYTPKEPADDAGSTPDAEDPPPGETRR